MRRVFVTGHRGFFGKHLIESLKLAFPDYLICWNDDLNLKDEQFTKQCMDSIQPHCVIHLAANPRGNAGLEVMQDNVTGTHNLVHYAPANCHFIFASSIVVYGNYKHFQFLEDMTPEPTSMYALSKWNAENIINRYARLGKIRKVNFRYSAIVGPNLSHGFIYDLTKKISSDSTELELIGSAPGSIKPFLHVEDACRSIIFAIQNNLQGTYNVCPTDNISVESIAKLAMRCLKREKPIKWRPDQVWAGDNNEIKAGNCKLFSKGFVFKHKSSLSAIREYFDGLIQSI